MSTTPKVYAAITAVQAELAREGIAKDAKNVQQGYQYRSIDAICNAMSGVLARHHLCILPRILSRTAAERITKSGTTLFSVVVEAEFDLRSAEDGSSHVVKTFGEAMDSGDKATNKAMSAAYKYALMQTFCLPTEGDADAETPEETVPAKKTESADDKEVAALRSNLESDPSLKNFNSKLPNLKELGPVLKKAKWETMLSVAEQSGLYFDRDKLEFVTKPTPIPSKARK